MSEVIKVMQRIMSGLMKASDVETMVYAFAANNGLVRDEHRHTSSLIV